MAKLLHPDNTVTDVEPKNGTDFNLEELQGFVGGHIEVVYLRGAPNHILVVNEEGKLQGMPFNLFATRVFAAANGPHDSIVGPALLCKTSEVK